LRFSYPYIIDRQEHSVIVEFPDVPGALTEVREGERGEAIIRDCLISALGGYIESKITPPAPSAPRGRPFVTLDLVTSAKITLAMAMAEQRMSNVELAHHMGVNEKVVRRMLDPGHRSRIDRLEDALDQLGLGVELMVRPVTRHLAGN
jgi:antitoxin HicB